MSSNDTTIQCPICENLIDFSGRYGNYICNYCVNIGIFTGDGFKLVLEI
mgnify:FL=1